MHENETNQDETYDAINQWLSNVEDDLDTDNDLCYSMRIAEIENLLP